MDKGQERDGQGLQVFCEEKREKGERQRMWYVADLRDESFKVEERNKARGHWNNLNGPCGQHKAQVPLMGQACWGFYISLSRAGSV